MRDHGPTEGLNSELLENACHVSQTVPWCTRPAHLLHQFLLVTHSQGAPFGIHRLTFFRSQSVTDFLIGVWHIVSSLAPMQL
jgi:hypothetical protein